MTQQDTQPPAETLADREVIARIINDGYGDPKHPRPSAANRRWVLAQKKADAILAALTRRAGGDAIPAGEGLALRAIKAVTATGKDGPRALSRIMAITISAGVEQQYSELIADPDVALIVERQRTEWAHLFNPGTTGCAIPPDGWECSRERGHAGPCAAAPKPPAGGDAGSSHTPNAYVLLEPDAEDVRLLAQGVVARCPCCAGTPSTFSRLFPHSGIYQAYVNCSRCHVQVLSNARDRAEAREQAIAAWSKRPVSAGGDAGAVARAVETMRRSRQAWSNVLEFGLIAESHREATETLIDQLDEASAALALPAPVVEGEIVPPENGEPDPEWRAIKRAIDQFAGRVPTISKHRALNNAHIRTLVDRLDAAGDHEAADTIVWQCWWRALDRERERFLMDDANERIAALSEGRSHG